MRLRFATFAALLSVAALVIWLARSRPAGEETPLAPPPAVAALAEETGGSRVPCAVPLAWRVARVDPAFGVTEVEAARALEEAMALWADAVGRPLFALDPSAGSPVRLVYDDRQARTAERRTLEAEIEEKEEALEADRAALAELAAARDRQTTELEERARALERDIAAHNALVRGWNERGGAPADTLAASAARGERLDGERALLQEQEVELEALGARVRDETARFQRRIDEHNARIAELNRRFPPIEVESGVYREAVRTEGGDVPAVSREIRIHRFDDHADLVRVLAHELGHAIGLGHAPEEGALMSAAYGRGMARAQGGIIRPEDVRALAERCPGVVG